MRLLSFAFRASLIGGVVLSNAVQDAHAQDPGSDAGASADHERVVVLTLWPQDHGALAAQFGLVAECCDPELGMYAFRPQAGTTQAELDDIVESAESNWVVVAASRDGGSRVPEVESCSLIFPDLVSVQDCTVGFVSGGTPLIPCEPNPWLEQIGAVGLPDPDKTTLVAVIDTGVDPTHPSLADRMAGEGFDFLAGVGGGFTVFNGLDDDGDGLIDEGAYHGTQVASLICQVDPGARILPYRVCDSEGNGHGYDVARAIALATKQGADVINLSLSFSEKHDAVDSALRAAIAAGVEVCVAAGNTGSSNELYPSTIDEDNSYSLAMWKYPYGVLAVSAVDASGQRATFGAWGEHIDVVAPSVGLCAAAPGGAWAPFSGTSAATAVASGALSRVRSEPAYKAAAGCAVELLIGTATPLDYGDSEWAGQLGTGRVNVGAAMALIPPVVDPVDGEPEPDAKSSGDSSGKDDEDED
ncbi:MAG: S8 family peptidase [Planctomycetota bacterium]|jgi:hypothetical protein